MENKDINVQFLLRPGSSVAEIKLKPGQQITAEGGSMIAMSEGISLETSTRQKKSGGIMSGLKRMISGENFFLNHYTAGAQGGTLFLATTHVGDMESRELNGEGLVIQGGSFVACSNDVQIDASWQGFKNILSGESMFWVKAHGRGTIIFNSFGAIEPIDIQGSYIVDTGHIVAFEEQLNFTLTKAGKSWASSILGGEGLVCKFQGNGRVWIQSHSPTAFGRILGPKLKPR